MSAPNNNEIASAEASTSLAATEHQNESHEHHEGHEHCHHDHVHHDNENHHGHIHSPGHLVEHKSMVGVPIVEVAEQLGENELPLFTTVPSYRK